MRRLRGLMCSLVLYLLLAPTLLHAGLVVKSDTTRQYWIIRQDFMQNMPGPDPARFQRIEHSGAYGPHPISGLPMATKATVSYFVFPLCRGRMKAPGELARGDQPSVQVDCL